MKKTILTLAFGLLLSGQAAFALTADQLVSDLQAQGYTRTEVRVGPSQIKVEAIRGTEKLEVIYDKTTGAVLKSEVATVRFGENTAPGVSVRDRNRDFVRLVAGTRSSDDDSGNDDSTDDNGGDRVEGGNSRDSSSDDDHGRGRGSDDGDDHDDNDDDRDDNDDNDDNDDGDDSDDDNGGDR